MRAVPAFGCLEALGVRPPLPDGSYDYEQSMSLQARSYVTSDRWRPAWTFGIRWGLPL
jgi:hypothetical protein